MPIGARSASAAGAGSPDSVCGNNRSSVGEVSSGGSHTSCAAGPQFRILSTSTSSSDLVSDSASGGASGMAWTAGASEAAARQVPR